MKLCAILSACTSVNFPMPFFICSFYSKATCITLKSQKDPENLFVTHNYSNLQWHYDLSVLG